MAMAGYMLRLSTRATVQVRAGAPNSAHHGHGSCRNTRLPPTPALRRVRKARARRSLVTLKTKMSEERVDRRIHKAWTPRTTNSRANTIKQSESKSGRTADRSKTVHVGELKVNIKSTSERGKAY